MASSWLSVIAAPPRMSRPRSPPARQAPHPRRDQFHRISGGVTKVQGLAPSRPLHFFFDADAVAVQVLAPAVEGFGLNAQGEMAWPGGTVRRQLVAPQRGFGQESEQ